MTFPYDKTSPDSISAYAKKLEGKSLKQVVKDLPEAVNSLNKGDLGQLIEEYYFLYKPNNIKAPDFPEAGLELKSTPLRQTKIKGLVAKERLVLNIIDFFEEYKLSWKTSSFWKKNQRLLLIFYLHKKGSLVVNRVIDMTGIWDYSQEDLLLMEQDWNKIVSKIKRGKAHEISEGDTFYLGACTKGAGHGADMKPQPFSTTEAHQRAFSLKRHYVNQIATKWRRERESVEPVVKDPLELKETSFEELVLAKFKPFIGKSVEEISARLRMTGEPSAKGYFAAITRRILDVKAKEIEEFKKAGIITKTVRVKKNGMPKEDISFPYFKYKELAKESWETSTLRETLTNKFFFVVFKYDKNNRLILKGATFWNMPERHLEKEAKRVWLETVKRINEKRSGFLPKKSESTILHVRPHAANKADTDLTPEGTRVVKKSFWLNSSYIKQQVLGRLGRL